MSSSSQWAMVGISWKWAIDETSAPHEYVFFSLADCAQVDLSQCPTVPDALDIWMRGNDSQTIITWKVSAGVRTSALLHRRANTHFL